MKGNSWIAIIVIVSFLQVRKLENSFAHRIDNIFPYLFVEERVPPKLLIEHILFFQEGSSSWKNKKP